jgi:hypothetical protein
VHVLVEPALRVALSHDRSVGSTGLRFKVTAAVLSRPLASNLAVMVTLSPAVTVPAVVVKAPDTAWAATDTDAGIISSGLFALRRTVCALATVRSNWTVQVLELPEVRNVGLQLSEDTAGALARIREAVAEAPCNEAVRVMSRFPVKVPAVAVKVAEVSAADTVTVAGMLSLALLSDSATRLPPGGAGSFKVTVQTLLASELIVPGLQVNAETSTAGIKVKEALWELAFKLAVTVTL